jgi:hypothetical protein
LLSSPLSFFLLQNSFCDSFPLHLLENSLFSFFYIFLLPDFFCPLLCFFSFSKLRLSENSVSNSHCSFTFFFCRDPFALSIFLSQNSFCNSLPLFTFIYHKTLSTLFSFLHFSLGRLLLPSFPPYFFLVFSHVRLSQNSIRNSHSPFIFFFCETLFSFLSLFTKFFLLLHFSFVELPCLFSPFSFFSFAKLILKFLSLSHIYLSQNSLNLLSPFALLLPYSNFYLFLSQNSFCNWLPLLMFVFGKTPLVTLIPLLSFSFARLFFPSSSFAKLSFLLCIFLLENSFGSLLPFTFILLQNSFCNSFPLLTFIFRKNSFSSHIFLLRDSFCFLLFPCFFFCKTSFIISFTFSDLSFAKHFFSF